MLPAGNPLHSFQQNSFSLTKKEVHEKSCPLRMMKCRRESGKYCGGAVEPVNMFFQKRDVGFVAQAAEIRSLRKNDSVKCAVPGVFADRFHTDFENLKGDFAQTLGNGEP